MMEKKIEATYSDKPVCNFKTVEDIVAECERETLAYDTFILGEDPRCHVSTDCYETQLNNNFTIVGGSGSGKTRSVMMPILLHLKHSNAIGIFTKWGMLTSIRRLLQKRGYKVHVLNLSEPDKSDYSFDPLVYCKTDEDIRDLAQAIIYSAPQGGGSKDPYWDTSAANLLEIVLWTVKHYALPGKDTMATALCLLEWLIWNDDEYDWKDMDEREMEQYPAHYILDKFSENDPVKHAVWRNYKKLPDTTGACVTSSLQTPLNAVFPAAVRRCISGAEQFDFSKLTDEKTVLFVYVSPVNVANHRYAALFYNQVFKSLFEIAEARKGRVLPYPVHVLCDDFATGGKIPNFEKHISIFREKRIAVTMLLQSETQLSSIYGKMDAKTIINNCDTYVFLGGMDDETIESIAKKTDVPASEIRNMPIGTEYFIRRGQKAIRTKRYDISKDPIYLSEIKGREEEDEAVSCAASREEMKPKSSAELFELFDIKLPKQERNEAKDIPWNSNDRHRRAFDLH